MRNLFRIISTISARCFFEAVFIVLSFERVLAAAVLKTSLSAREVPSSISGPFKHSGHSVAIAAMLLPRGVAQMPSRECSEDLQT